MPINLNDCDIQQWETVIQKSLQYKENAVKPSVHWVYRSLNMCKNVAWICIKFTDVCMYVLRIRLHGKFPSILQMAHFHTQNSPTHSQRDNYFRKIFRFLFFFFVPIEMRQNGNQCSISNCASNWKCYKALAQHHQPIIWKKKSIFKLTVSNSISFISVILFGIYSLCTKSLSTASSIGVII